MTNQRPTARIVRGTSTVSTTNDEKWVSGKDTNFVVEACKNLLAAKRIDTEHAAISITSELRSIFISGLQLNGDTIDIDMLRYIDERLFENVKYLIASILQYGRNDMIKTLIVRQFENVGGVIEYQCDESSRIKITKIIEEVCK